MTFETKYPELNANQKAMMLRELLACLPNKMEETGSIYEPQHKIAVFHNVAIIGAEQAIKEYFGEL